MKTNYSPEDFPELVQIHDMAQLAADQANALLPAIKEAWTAELNARLQEQATLLREARKRLKHSEECVAYSNPKDCSACHFSVKISDALGEE